MKYKRKINTTISLYWHIYMSSRTGCRFGRRKDFDDRYTRHLYVRRGVKHLLYKL